MILDTDRKRLEAFSRCLHNAGLQETAITRVVEVVSAYEASRRCPPSSQEEILIYVREAGLATPDQERSAEAFLGAYMVWSYPSTGIGAAELIQGLLALDAGRAVEATARALEGEGHAGHWLTRMIGVFRRESVRRYLAPLATTAIIAVAFLENPLVRFYAMMMPRHSAAFREIDERDPAVADAKREAELARDLAVATWKRWDQKTPPTIDQLAALTTNEADYAALVDRYALDSRAWESTAGDRSARSPSLVLQARSAPLRVIHVGGGVSTVVDPGFVISVGAPR
jgi:hypothetical protein